MLRANLESAFTLILSLCTKLNRINMERLLTCRAVDDSYDVIRPIKIIKSLSY